MNFLTIAIIVFICLETTNIITMYFWPHSKYANSVGTFKAFEESKKYPEIHEFIRYMVFWVAGTKLIFIALLIVILLTGTETTKILTGGALVLSIASFYWRLYPIVKKLDGIDQITPKGYSKALNLMIASFMTMFAIAVYTAL